MVFPGLMVKWEAIQKRWKAVNRVRRLEASSAIRATSSAKSKIQSRKPRYW